MKLIINGYEIELAPNVNISRTLQVNDIGSPQTRQASYTNTFNIPRTSNNVKAFKMLGIIGNNSNVPYQKNEAYLYDDSGFCLVYKGWSVISETTKDFKCNVYDGIIDFYKSIENKTLADLDLSVLAHEKTPAEIVSTQDLAKPYVYILADYNGKVKTGANISSDYLVPSVKVPWLWERIEEFTGFTLNGSFKTNPDFTNLFLTYPKGIPPTISSDIYASNNIAPNSTTVDFNNRTTYPNLNFYTSINTSILKLSLTDTKDLVAQKTTKLKVTFTINPFFYVENILDPIEISYYLQASFNGSTILCDGSFQTISTFISVNQGDVINFPFIFNFVENIGIITINDFFVNVSIQELTNAVLFEEEFKGMSIKQFVSEILWRFNLTIFKDAFSDSYTLKYLSEIINVTPLDWSSKFSKLESENYIVGDYGQRSWLRYKYDDINSFYNDGYFDINNTNLSEAKTVIQSSTYSPEFNTSEEIGFTSNIYKFWNREIKDNGLIDYKPVSNRFYFLKAIPITLTGQVLKSDVLNQTATITSAQKESFANLTFTSIMEDYYTDMQKLLNQSKVINVSLRLTEIDIVNIDFSKPIYIKQLGGSFLINKIQNFVPFKDTKVELIKLN